ncbi:CrcB family protein [Corynebacterium bovis]|uniref:CrcB family protein n=1 Tax=Corynebacterium bovis TaxID=36808 RepID=UPI003139C77E
MADGSAGHPRADRPTDPGADRRADLPPYLRPAAVATVAGGGALGSVLRWCATTLPGGGDLGPLLAVNVVGALLLGLLTTVLARSGPDTGLRRTVRLGLGTGVLGGFTSYSALAAAVTTGSAAGGAGPSPVGVAYVAVSVGLGLVAAWAGIRAGERLVPDTAATSGGGTC